MGKDNRAQDQQIRRLIQLHGGAVRSLIARREYNYDDVDDISADVFRLAYEHLDMLSEATPAQVRGWLLVTARNLSANHVRRSISRRRLIDKLARQLETLGVADGENEEEQATARERDQRVRDVLEGMRDDYRLVLVMDALGDPDGEIARVLGVTPNAARKRLMRARIAFRAQYLARLESLEGVPHE